MDTEVEQIAIACPECGSTNVRRSHRKGAIEIFLSERMRRDPYRCDSCLARFFRVRAGEPPERVYRPPSATPAPLQLKVSHGEALQKRRRFVMLLVGGASTTLATFFVMALKAGGHEPNPTMLRLTRIFGKHAPAPPAGRRRR